jgi:hypothetical protein
VVAYEGPGEVLVGKRFAIELELPGIGEIIGYHFDLDFDHEVLVFEGTNLDELLQAEGNRIASLDSDTGDGLEVCRAVLGAFPADRRQPSRVEFYFRALQEVEETSVSVSKVDLRNAANRPWLLGPEALETEWSFGVTGHSALLPSRFALWQNAPNPFAGRTAIRFDLPRPADVELTVYDVQGRSVVKLVRGTLPAGTHEVIWDGRNDKGDPAASGIYFCGFKTPGYIEVKRLLLTR